MLFIPFLVRIEKWFRACINFAWVTLRENNVIDNMTSVIILLRGTGRREPIEWSAYLLLR